MFFWYIMWNRVSAGFSCCRIGRCKNFFIFFCAPFFSSRHLAVAKRPRGAGMARAHGPSGFVTCELVLWIFFIFFSCVASPARAKRAEGRKVCGQRALRARCGCASSRVCFFVVEKIWARKKNIFFLRAQIFSTTKKHTRDDAQPQRARSARCPHTLRPSARFARAGDATHEKKIKKIHKTSSHVTKPLGPCARAMPAPRGRFATARWRLEKKGAQKKIKKFLQRPILQQEKPADTRFHMIYQKNTTP